MSLTIDQLRNFAGTGAISIDAGQKSQPAEIKRTGFLHAIKTFFGFKSAKAQNEATLNAIRSAIQNDPKLFLAHKRGDELLGAVKGTITAEKVRSIISDLEESVGKMDKTERHSAVDSSIRGRIAAAGTPKFARDLGPEFMKYYPKMIAGTLSKTEPPGGWGSVDFAKEIKTCQKTVSDCFKIIGDNPADRKAFASMVSDNRTKILINSGTGVMHTGKKCLQIARDAKALFDKAHELSWKHGSISEKLAMESIKSMDTLISPDLLGKLVETGRKMDTSDLEKLGHRSGVKVINEALDGFIAKFNTAIKDVLAGLPGDISADTKMAIQELVIHNAVDSLPAELKEDMAEEFTTNGPFVAEQSPVKAKFMEIMKAPLEMATQINFDDPEAEEDMAEIIPNIVDNSHNVEDTADLEDLQRMRGKDKLFDV